MEEFAAAELREHRCTPTVVPGGITLPADQIGMALLHSRLASGATLTVGSVRRDKLPDALRGIPWAKYINPGQKIEVVLRGIRRRGLDKKCTAVIARHAAKRRIRGGAVPVARVWLIGAEEGPKVEVAIEAGRELWKRGWRTNPGRAPLRENLAAGVLRALRWSPDEPLVDAMCGSGTFLIEAAHRALGRPPGGYRRFAAESWPSFDVKAMAAARNMKRSGNPRLYGSDRDGRQLDAASKNAKKARVERHITFSEVAFQEREPPVPQGLFVCNPPYGDRIRATDRTFGLIGDRLEKHWSGYRYGVLLPDVRLSRYFPGHVDTSIVFPHGGKRIWLAQGKVQ